MKKISVLLAAATLMLGACAAESSTTPVVPNDGATIATAYTVDEAIAKIAELELPTDGTLSDEAYYVTGEVFSSSYNTKYDAYVLWLKNGETDKAFEVYNGHFVEGLDVKDYRATDALKGATVVCWGFLEDYNGTKELGGGKSKDDWVKVCTIANAENGKDWVEATDITVAETDLTVKVGQTVTISTTLVPENANPKGWAMTYTSAAEATATVSATGVVSGVAVGSTTVTVTGKSTAGQPIVKTVNITVQADATVYTKIAAYDFTDYGKAVGEKQANSAVNTAGLKSCADTTAPLTDIIAADDGDNLAVTGEKIYAKQDKYEALGIKMGTSSVNGTLTIKLTKSVKKVVVKAAGWTDSDGVDVNTTGAQVPGVAYTEADCVKELSFVLATAASEVTIVTTKRAYINAIEFYQVQA